MRAFSYITMACDNDNHYNLLSPYLDEFEDDASLVFFATALLANALGDSLLMT